MSDIKYTTVDRVLSELNRGLRGTDLNETDMIEWIGQALDFMQMPEVQEEAVAFLKVENHEVELPDGFQMVLQIAKYNKEPEAIEENCDCLEDGEPDLSTPDCCQDTPVLDCMLNCITPFKPYFDMQWQYIPWTVSTYYVEHFQPVRLANNTLFNSIVCKEKSVYENCGPDEYTIVGTVDKKLRFSFKEGFVALSYIKSALDSNTGYPLVPDNIRHIQAINYYVRWKIAEYLDWNGREGFGSKAESNMQLWLKYVKQAKNYTKMPKSIDQFQNLLEQSHYLIPRHNRYYKYFGNMSRAEDRKFNDPDRRNHYGRR